jgi:signal transduction histidine kinase
LPIFIGGLLVLVTAIYASAAYQGMRRALVTISHERLAVVGDQFAQMFHRSRDQLLENLRRTADSAAVRDFLTRPSDAARARATKLLTPATPQGQQVIGSELLNVRGQGVLSTGDPRRWGGPSVEAGWVNGGGSGQPDSGTVGRFRLVGDSVVYAAAVPVRSGGQLVGHLVQWRRVAASRQSLDDLSRLIGTGARLYVGDLADDVWTDLSGPAPAPPIDLQHATGAQQYARDSVGTVLAAARPINGTPWGVVVEFPRSAVLTPTRQFLWRLWAIAAVIVALGLVGAWVLSRVLTRPLGHLTQAAEAVAGGDYTQLTGPAVAGRQDELGRLAGAFDTMVTHVRDSQHQLEDRVQQRTAELQERNEELEAFGYSISHDLRAPLRAMEGFSRALLEDYGDRLDETGVQYAQRVVTAAQSMDELIRDLLAYSRITRAELRLVPVEVDRLVRAAVEQLDAEIRGRNAQVVVSPPLPPVMGHDATLAQVLANLLGNGMKFVPKGRTPEVRVRAERRNGNVRLWIEDNGIGIAPEHHERIFRVFERLHGASDYPGTGIGLAIVRKGVERMGGRVGVESAVGGGSKFWIELPQAEAASERHGYSAG